MKIACDGCPSLGSCPGPGRLDGAQMFPCGPVYCGSDRILRQMYTADRAAKRESHCHDCALAQYCSTTYRALSSYTADADIFIVETPGPWAQNWEGARCQWLHIPCTRNIHRAESILESMASANGWWKLPPGAGA